MSQSNLDRGDNLDATSDASDETEDLEGKLESEDGEDTGEIDEGTTKVETKDPVIPKKRFDQAVGKARKEAEAASKRAEEAEGKLKAQQGTIDAEKVETEIDDLYDKADQASADGNKELLKLLRREIREKQTLLADARAEVKAAYRAAQAIEQVRYDRVVEDMERDHPELNPDNEDIYEQESVDEIMELTEAYVAKGEGTAAAFKKAIKVFFKNAPVKEAKEEPDEEENERKEAAAKKALAAKGKQPPAAKTGLNSDKGGKKEKTIDVNKVSSADWGKLTKEEKAAMRGDNL